jgi:heat shock protein HslJ/uncharacterized membrane protein
MRPQIFARTSLSAIPLVSLALAGCATTPPPAASTPLPAGPWEEARLRGAEFRAAGQEPGWHLEVHADGAIHFVGDYGEATLRAPRSTATAAADGGRVVTAQAGGRALRVEIREAFCADAMSGEPFTHSVLVRLDDQVLQGCGRSLAVPPLAGLAWRLEVLRGEPVPHAEGEAAVYLDFDATAAQVAGSTGCNRLNGPVEVRAGTLRFGTLATTRRACGEPDRARREREFVAVLQATDRYALEEGVLVFYGGGEPLARFTGGAVR